MNWKALIAQIAAIALATNPKTAPLVPHVIAGIQLAETMPGKTGKEKLAIAAQIANEGFAAANSVVPGVVDVPSATALTTAISAIVNSTNIVHTNAIVWGS